MEIAMQRTAYSVTFFLLLSSFAFGQQTPQEQAVWKLEHQYWEYVKAVDLTGYRSLWHEQFVGWPMMSATPVHKDHITDWITANTSKGVKMRTATIKEAASQSIGDNLVVTHYWMTDAWGDEKEVTSRITHTWLLTKDGWKIVGGMSSLEHSAP
jgi:hypothetical protein